MTREPLKRFAFFLLTYVGTLGAANSAPVALTPPDMSTYILQISKMNGSELCMVGQTMDPNGDLQSRGKVIIFSTAKNKVLWQQTVDAPDDNATVRFVACRSDGKFTYVGANVDTHSERSLSQALAYVYKFDAVGKLLVKKELVTGGTNAFVYDLDVDSTGVTVIGMTSKGKAAAKANAIYFAKTDVDLKASSMTKLATGAYQNGSIVKLSGNVALVGGNFLPAVTKKPVNDYAVSKIVAGKYQFSVRPQQGKPDQVATAITATGDIVSLGNFGNASVLTAVSAEGKTTQTMPVKSALCQTESMSANAESVFAVRKGCAHPEEPAKLVAINRRSGVETIKVGMAGVPLFVFPLDEKVFVVTKNNDGSLLLHSFRQGE